MAAESSANKPSNLRDLRSAPRQFFAQISIYITFVLLLLAAEIASQKSRHQQKKPEPAPDSESTGGNCP